MEDENPALGKPDIGQSGMARAGMETELAEHSRVAAAPASASNGGRRGIQSVETGMKLLRVLIEAEGPQSLTELARTAGMSASKAHRYLASFEREGLVRQDPGTGVYDLGVMALRLGMAALGRVDQVGEACARLAGLVEKTGCTARLSVWGERGPVIIRMARGDRTYSTAFSIGSILPVIRSATGRVFLAFLPEVETRHLVKEALAHDTVRFPKPGPISARADLDHELSQIRELKLAFTDGYITPGMRVIASPVLNSQRQAAAVVSLIGNDIDLIDRKGAAASQLRRFCENLSV